LLWDFVKIEERLMNLWEKQIWWYHYLHIQMLFKCLEFVWIEGTQRPVIVMEYCSGGGLSVNSEKNKQTSTSQLISLSQLFKLTHTHNHT
jgi:hypothetical protein